MIYFDEKQRNIIESWFARGDGADTDSYAAFMSIWIAFNAFCYGLYAAEANRRRPNLKKDNGLQEIGEVPRALNGSISHAAGKFSIAIDEPGRIVIDIVERYTEDIIFAQFGRDFQDNYTKWLATDATFASSVEELRNALAKPNRGHFVINMARISDYPGTDQPFDQNTFNQLANRNVVIPFEDATTLRSLINALYQIRCNIFHGEKVPGEPNDDWIVKAALMPLKKIVFHCIETLK